MNNYLNYLVLREHIIVSTVEQTKTKPLEHELQSFFITFRRDPKHLISAVKGTISSAKWKTQRLFSSAMVWSRSANQILGFSLFSLLSTVSISGSQWPARGPPHVWRQNYCNTSMHHLLTFLQPPERWRSLPLASAEERKLCFPRVHSTHPSLTSRLIFFPSGHTPHHQPITVVQGIVVLSLAILSHMVVFFF